MLAFGILGSTYFNLTPADNKLPPAERNLIQSSFRKKGDAFLNSALILIRALFPKDRSTDNLWSAEILQLVREILAQKLRQLTKSSNYLLNKTDPIRFTKEL